MPWIALLALSVSIDLVSASARVTSVKFQKRDSLSDGQTSGPIDRTPGLPGSDKNRNAIHKIKVLTGEGPKLLQEVLGGLWVRVDFVSLTYDNVMH